MLFFCHICVTAIETGKMKDGGNVDDAFIYSGYSNWKNASGNTGGFSCHERSRSHKTALEVVVSLPQTTGRNAVFQIRRGKKDS